MLSPYSLGRTLNQYDDLSFNCSTAISVDSSGEVSQAGTLTTISADSASYSNLASLRGLYFKPQYGGFGFDYNSKTYIAVDTSEIYYVPPSANYVRTGNNPYYMGIDAQLVGSEWIDGIGDWEYIQSSDRNAYPDSGIQDGYEYQFLGKPLDNAVEASKIETGSYIGTGTYGSSNPNSLTFSFRPKLFFLDDQKGSNLYYGSGWLVYTDFLDDSYEKLPLASQTYYYPYMKFENNVLTWYCYNGSDNVSAYQMNTSGTTYYYIAIG